MLTISTRLIADSSFQEGFCRRHTPKPSPLQMRRRGGVGAGADEPQRRGYPCEGGRRRVGTPSRRSDAKAGMSRAPPRTVRGRMAGLPQAQELGIPLWGRFPVCGPRWRSGWLCFPTVTRGTDATSPVTTCLLGTGATDDKPPSTHEDHDLRLEYWAAQLFDDPGVLDEVHRIAWPACTAWNEVA
jgi:hypothetical protein